MQKSESEVVSTRFEREKLKWFKITAFQTNFGAELDCSGSEKVNLGNEKVLVFIRLEVLVLFGLSAFL